MPNEAIVLQDTELDELPTICEMEQRSGGMFVIPYSLQKHQDEFDRPTVRYKSIRRAGKLIGFLILALDPDGESIEFRRIVVSEPGHGVGQRAVEMVSEICRRDFRRKRIWLETNERARRVYEKSGYRQFGVSDHLDRTLLLYEKAV